MYKDYRALISASATEHYSIAYLDFLSETPVYTILYSTLYAIWGEYQIQSVCLCVCLSRESCPLIDLRS